MFNLLSRLVGIFNISEAFFPPECFSYPLAILQDREKRVDIYHIPICVPTYSNAPHMCNSPCHVMGAYIS